MIWAEFEAEAPEMAGLGRERFERAGVALLGTIRQDGSPRISPIEPFFASGQLLLGLLPRSLKARDVRRDARCVLHSAIAGANTGESEFKLYGTVEGVDDHGVRESVPGAWWVGRPLDHAYVVSFDVRQAGLVAWNLEASEMTTLRWSPADGLTRRTRRYP